MREKRPHVIFTFHTTAGAMAMEKQCRKQDLPGRLIPTPRSVTADCGIAWAAPLEDRIRLEQAEGLPEPAAIFEKEL